MCITDGKYGCVHAEINCLTKCRTHESALVMFITLAPCKQCAAAIINSANDFHRVYYFEDWKESTGINMLKAANIQVVKI